MADVWILQNDQWILGTLLNSDNSISYVKVNDETVQINSKYVFHTSYENPLDVEDLIKLSHLNEPSVLNTLELRYKNNKIYTDTGPVLIAINPFKQLDIYTDSDKTKYNTEDRSFNNEDSHVYKIAQKALYNLLQNNMNQTILASGESGSGKTVTTKHILHYLTSISDSNANIKDVVIFSNPLMEAFGNSKTIRNDNSSRFGKFIQLFIDSNSKISSGTIKTYLLEKIRVVQQNKGERNFHIFYQFLSSEKKNSYGLLSVDNYNILNNKDNNSIKLESESDSDNFDKVMHALTIMNFSNDDIDKIFTTIAIILNIGNLKFTSLKFTYEHDITQIVVDSYVDQILNLSQWTIDDLTDFFCHEYINVNNECIKKNLNIETSIIKLHTFMQELYQILFNFIVTTINRNLQQNSDNDNENDNGDNSDNFIGILDIFGFEIFNHNSLEQLHINYTNECLQQIFNKNIFKTEQEEYIKENINWKLISYIDNADRLNDIDGQLSIFSYLDEECFVPKGNDVSLLSKLDRCKLKHIMMTNLEKAKGNFTFSHYAGAVQYNINTFVHKNKYHTNSAMISFLNKSSVIVNNDDCDYQKNKKTISATFKTQLQQLVQIISKTENYFVRCIKPNDINNSDNFNVSKIMMQLRYGGITEAVRVVQAGFPIKLSHSYFRDKYYPLTLNYDMNFNGFRTKFLTKDIPHMQIGATKIFMKQNVYEELECLKRNKLIKSSNIIKLKLLTRVYRNKFLFIKNFALLFQSLFRGYIGRKHVNTIKKNNAIIRIQTNVRMINTKKWFVMMIKNIKLIQSSFKIYRYNNHLKTIQSYSHNAISILSRVKIMISTLTIRNWYIKIKTKKNNKILLLTKQLIDEQEKAKLLKEMQVKLLSVQQLKFEEEKRQDNEMKLMFREEHDMLQIIKENKLIKSENDFNDTLKVNGSLIERMVQILDESEDEKIKNHKMKLENDRMRLENEQMRQQLQMQQNEKKSILSRLFWR